MEIDDLKCAIKDELCYEVNEIIGKYFRSLRECSRKLDLPISLLVRLSNYSVSELKVDKIIDTYLKLKQYLNLNCILKINLSFEGHNYHFCL